MKIFISHSSYDKWIASKIAQDLQAAGVETFLDTKDLTAGDAIPHLITHNLRDSDEILILLTPASIQSQWVLIELGGAIALDKHIIPILHHVNPETIPKSISNLLARDLNDIELCYKEIKTRAERLQPYSASSEASVKSAIIPDSRRVFLIHGYDKRSPGTTDRILDFLRSCGLEVETASPYASLGTEIEGGLLERMKRCIATVIVCTLDVKEGDGTFRPSQNVLWEAGIALGLNRGAKKFVVLQRWGLAVGDQAQLPFELSELSPIRFEQIDSVLDELRSRLSDLGVTVSARV